MTFSKPLPSNILSGYAKGYNPGDPPFKNTLAEAQRWCCEQGGAICGGITHQATDLHKEGAFTARAGRDPKGCTEGCGNTSSWLLIGQ